MKYVRRLGAEPPLMREYRLAYPGEEMRPGNEARAAWEDFKTDRRAYEELLEQLVEAQQGLCIYCEQRLVDKNKRLVSQDYQVEHVLAKSGGPQRVLDWQNLALACGGGTYGYHREEERNYLGTHNTSCGQTKGSSELPSGGDPRSFPLIDPLVEVGLDGRLSSRESQCISSEHEPVHIKQTIELLNLNCERLRKARQAIGDNTRGKFVELLRALAADVDEAPENAAVLEFVASQLAPDAVGALSPFWSAARSALGEPAQGWLMNHQGLFE